MQVPIRLYTLYSWCYSQLEDLKMVLITAEQKQFCLEWEKAYGHYIAGDWRVNKCTCKHTSGAVWCWQQRCLNIIRAQ